MAATGRNGREAADRIGSSAHVPALAFIELSSISRGLYLTDLILKKAPVKVIASQPVSSGKHAILYMGDVASVDESHREALAYAEGTVVKEIFIPGIHEQLAPFLDSLWTQNHIQLRPSDAVGIVESQTLAGAILAADRALKAATVLLCKMRLGQGIGGKAYFVLTGRLEEVEASLEAARTILEDTSSLCRVDLVARPSEEALAHF